MSDQFIVSQNNQQVSAQKGWRMVKSETADTPRPLFKNPSRDLALQKSEPEMQ